VVAALPLACGLHVPDDERAVERCEERRSLWEAVVRLKRRHAQYAVIAVVDVADDYR
jgi:hypothetical protein